MPRSSTKALRHALQSTNEAKRRAQGTTPSFATALRRPSSRCTATSSTRLVSTSTRHGCLAAPMPHTEVCAPGQLAVIFDTGLVDASSVGINDRNTYKFRRRTTCFPLNTGFSYVTKKIENGTETFSYYYGKKVDANITTDYTLRTSGNAFDWLTPGYRVEYVEPRPSGLTNELTTIPAPMLHPLPRTTICGAPSTSFRTRTTRYSPSSSSPRSTISIRDPALIPSSQQTSRVI
jgi:hypothetical protein